MGEINYALIKGQLTPGCINIFVTLSMISKRRPMVMLTCSYYQPRCKSFFDRDDPSGYLIVTLILTVRNGNTIGLILKGPSYAKTS